MKHINQRINNILKDHIPEGVKLVPFLMNLLNISRESAYRRLRNEIAYTVEEVAILAPELKISFEDIFNNSENKSKAYLSLDTASEGSPSDNYVHMMRMTTAALNKATDNQYTKAFFVGNKIPNSLLLNYDLLSKLRYIKWIHRTHDLPMNSRFSEMIVSEEVLNAHKEYIEASKKVNYYTGIFDYNIIQAAINTIKFYYRRGFITDRDALEMKEELLSVLDRIESIARTGKSMYSVDNVLYLSYVPIESNIILFEFDEGMSIHLLASGKEPIITSNLNVCEGQKQWIESLLKFSVSITCSNELLQSDFFSKQRQLIIEQLTSPHLNNIY